MVERIREATIRRVFDVSLVLKGVFALLESIAGILAYVVRQETWVALVQRLSHEELLEDPRDIVANYLVHAAQDLSVSAQHFAALYLLSHGIVKLWLISGLLQRRLWYYPTAMGIFGLFIIYQAYRYSLTHSPLLLLITALDVIVIALTWHEYSYLRRLHGAAARR